MADHALGVATLTHCVSEWFSHDEWRLFLASYYGPEITNTISTSASPDVYFHESIEALDRRGRLSRVFFRRVIKVRPLRSAELHVLASSFGVRFEIRFDLFLCYLPRDVLRARSCARELANLGVRAWFDETQLMPGQRWRPALADVRETLGGVVVLADTEAKPWADPRMALLLREFHADGFPVFLLTTAVMNRLPSYLGDALPCASSDELVTALRPFLP